MSVYRAAFALAARGVPTFPCAPGQKRPLTPRGLHDASTDPAVIRGWQRRWPTANLAIPTGMRSGLFVVDVDRHSADGRQTLCALEQTLGALPWTTTVQTPSGGEHRYFRMPRLGLRNSAGRIGAGVDTRGEGGYVVCPPSIVGDRSYLWSIRTAPAELPSAWIDALVPTERPPVPSTQWLPRTDREHSRATAWCLRALKEEARAVAAAPAGTRNDRLWRAAAALGGLLHTGGIDAEDVRNALGWACAQWAQRDPRKDLATLERGLAFGQAHPRTLNLSEDHRAA